MLTVPVVDTLNTDQTGVKKKLDWFIIAIKWTIKRAKSKALNHYLKFCI